LSQAVDASTLFASALAVHLGSAASMMVQVSGAFGGGSCAVVRARTSWFD
jgi:hypothetical protein